MLRIHLKNSWECYTNLKINRNNAHAPGWEPILTQSLGEKIEFLRPTPAV